MPSHVSDNGRSRNPADGISAHFLQRLHEMADEVYAPLLRDGTVHPVEVEEELMRYYAQKKSGLQSVYSYYGEQWNRFHLLSSAPDEQFPYMLQQLQPAFAARYEPEELDAAFYVGQLARFPRADARWQALRRHFMQKWKTLLDARERTYQLAHVERLCNDYFRMVREHVDGVQDQKEGVGPGSRLAWLQLTQSPAMREKLRQLSRVMRRSRLVKELNKALGRKEADEARLYRAMAGRTPVELWRRASRSDIVGVTEGDDLNALLPLEYGYLSEPQLEGLFLRRWSEKKLAVFDAVSRQRLHADASPRHGRDMQKRMQKGPFVVCVDTSTSMRGDAELLAKAIVLCVALLSERMGRTCRVVLFSDQATSIDLDNLYTDLPRLEPFLCNSFYGGSDIQAAMGDAASALLEERFAYADMLWLSDFEMPPASAFLRHCVEELKERDLRLYSVAFGTRCESSYLDLSHRVWWAEQG